MGESNVGRRIRELRAARSLTQKELAERVGISASYLNLIEMSKRPVTAQLLLRLAGELGRELSESASEAAVVGGDLINIFRSPMLAEFQASEADLTRIAEAYPAAAKAVRFLHEQYRETAETLDRRLRDLDTAQQLVGKDVRARSTAEVVSDFIQASRNYFPTLEAEAERVRREAGIEGDEVYGPLSRYLEQRHQVRVSLASSADMRSAIRRYDRGARKLQIFKSLRTGSRNFQLALQVGLIECMGTIDQLIRGAKFTSEAENTMGRLSLASYFAAAVLMPYQEFLDQARELRYDIELLGSRFHADWEQTCHRLTTLRQPGNEGVDFYMLRVDVAGNISKRFSAANIDFPRFSGLCPLWNVHAAFSQPGKVRVQVSQLDDRATTVLAIARTVVRRELGPYPRTELQYSVGVGCQASVAKGRVVYADGVNLEAPVPIGMTCRTCTRTQCIARAFPRMGEEPKIDEGVRGSSFFAPPPA